MRNIQKMSANRAAPTRSCDVDRIPKQLELGQSAMRSIFLTVTIASAFAGTSAVAGGIAEPVVEQPVIIPAADPVPVSDWTGPYVGLQLGTGSVDSDGADEVDISTAGVQAGYLYDMGRFVLGGELDYANVNFDDDSTFDADGNIARLKLRAGYDAGRVLPYLT
ncbi:outer membrane protein, partial [Palleronia sp.]|uniref:outer membrane protein n=1 Tax=Palleronia sp. TaxID=1940284 RepID=UPI0035C87B1C